MRAPELNDKGNDREKDLENDTLKFMINMIDKDLKRNGYDKDKDDDNNNNQKS